MIYLENIFLSYLHKIIAKAILSNAFSKPLKATMLVKILIHYNTRNNRVPRISGSLVVKSKLPPRSGCSLEAVEPHP